MPTTELTAKETAARNDRIRAILPMTHKQDRFVYTAGLDALGVAVVTEAILKVKAFSDFKEENDPYGEHDFGSFTVSTGDKCFWKVDDYRGTDGIRCVLTIMLSEDW